MTTNNEIKMIETSEEFGKLSINEVGENGDCRTRGESMKVLNNEGLDHEYDGDIEDSDEPSSPTSMIEFFQRNLHKEINVYSTEALPLNTPWTFWVDRIQRGANADEFEANLRLIGTIFTVERFWYTFDNIPKPSSLRLSNYYVMRNNRKPMWEESYNSKGGTFRVRVQKRDTDKVWRELLLAAIGEQLLNFVSDKDEICGVSVSMREQDDMIFIWNANNEESKNAKVFDCLRLLLPDTQFSSEFYKPHVSHAAFEKTKITNCKPRKSASEKNGLAANSANKPEVQH